MPKAPGVKVEDGKCVLGKRPVFFDNGFGFQSLKGSSAFPKNTRISADSICKRSTINPQFAESTINQF